MNAQLQQLLEKVEGHGLRLSRDFTIKHPMGQFHGYSVVTTRPGHRASPYLTAMVLEYDDGGYELFTPGATNSIDDDVNRLLGEYPFGPSRGS